MLVFLIKLCIIHAAFIFKCSQLTLYPFCGGGGGKKYFPEGWFGKVVGILANWKSKLSILSNSISLKILWKLFNVCTFPRISEKGFSTSLQNDNTVSQQRDAWYWVPSFSQRGLLLSAWRENKFHTLELHFHAWKSHFHAGKFHIFRQGNFIFSCTEISCFRAWNWNVHAWKWYSMHENENFFPWHDFSAPETFMGIWSVNSFMQGIFTHDNSGKIFLFTHENCHAWQLHFHAWNVNATLCSCMKPFVRVEHSALAQVLWERFVDTMFCLSSGIHCIWFCFVIREIQYPLLPIT